MNEQISELGFERKNTGNFIFQLDSSHLVVSLIRPGKKRVLVLVIGRVDFDANKKKCGPQNITRHREKYRVWYFRHLSIIDDRIHVCILT